MTRTPLDSSRVVTKPVAYSRGVAAVTTPSEATLAAT